MRSKNTHITSLQLRLIGVAPARLRAVISSYKAPPSVHARRTTLAVVNPYPLRWVTGAMELDPSISTCSQDCEYIAYDMLLVVTAGISIDVSAIFA
jgi:hypothetical protein